MRLFDKITFLLLTNLIFSQETSGILKGHVFDYKNTAIVGATITIYQKSTGFKSKINSQKEGFFIFNQLQPATDYEIEVEFSSFQNHTDFNIQIQLGKTTNLDVMLLSETQQLNEVAVNAVNSN